MAAPAPPLRRGPAERLLAWAATGPPGHLWSVVADVASFAGRSLVAAGARRLRRGRGS